MSLALLVVMAAAGFFVLDKSRDALEKAGKHTLERSAAMTMSEAVAARPMQLEILRETEGRDKVQWDKVLDRLLASQQASFTQGGTATGSGRVTRYPIKFNETSQYKDVDAFLLQFDGGGNVIAPADPYGGQGDSLYGLVLLASALVIGVGAGVSLMVSSQVTKPIEVLGEDVRSIARGNLHHKTRVRGGGEIQHLARQIDRMAGSLKEAQDTEVELGVRERERAVAGEVRDALLPSDWPEVAGYSLADLHEDSAEPGGDFHDFVEVSGKLVLIVCEVSGRGVPGALVGATARAYLKSELARDEPLDATLRKVNQQLARDVKRGMYVTALIVVIDPSEHIARVACAGHKLPLVRFDAEDGQVKLVQPGGIALGFDKGPIFDRSLEVAAVPIGPGDRFVLATTGMVQVSNPDGDEVGEKRFYKLIARNAEEEPEVMVESLLGSLDAFADGEEFPADLTLVALARD